MLQFFLTIDVLKRCRGIALWFKARVSAASGVLCNRYPGNRRGRLPLPCRPRRAPTDQPLRHRPRRHRSRPSQAQACSCPVSTPRSPPSTIPPLHAAPDDDAHVTHYFNLTPSLLSHRPQSPFRQLFSHRLRLKTFASIHKIINAIVKLSKFYCLEDIMGN